MLLTMCYGVGGSYVIVIIETCWKGIFISFFDFDIRVQAACLFEFDGGTLQ